VIAPDARPVTQAPIVFVIDDDVSVRDSVEDLLESVGLDVRVFASAQEFLAAERPEVPSCIVLDVRLPGASGLEFQRHLIERGFQLPIVFISGHGDIPMTVRAMKSALSNFLRSRYVSKSFWMPCTLRSSVIEHAVRTPMSARGCRRATTR
jgi:FixJ family two-component response regulator